jgi:Zn-dependent protease
LRKPIVVKRAKDTTAVGRLFGIPLVVKGVTWLPLTQLVVWAIMAWVAGRGRSDRSWSKRLGIGALTMSAILGSEWCHNLAHAAAARFVGKPMDALRVAWGMPLVVYHDVGDQTVTPRQHILRALGGPVFNALLLPFALFLQRSTREGSALRDMANAAVGMNTFLCTGSLLPIPGIDGGPILKWSLVERGATSEKADEMVLGVDRVMGAGLGVAAGVALKKRRWVMGTILALYAAIALAIGFGYIKEQE